MLDAVNTDAESRRTALTLQAPSQSPRFHPLDSTAAAESRPIVRRLVTKIHPQRLCDILAIGGRTAPWAESRLFPGEWECIADASPLQDQLDLMVERTPSPIFAMARGRNAKTVDYVRLKLSLPDDDQAPSAKEHLKRTSLSIVQAMGHDLPQAVRTSLENLQPIRMNEGRLEIVFSAEKQFPGRYNLIINLGS